MSGTWDLILILFHMSSNSSTTVISTKLDVESVNISFFEYLYVFMLVIYAGLSSNFVRSFSTFDRPMAVLIPLVMCVILAINSRIVFNRQIVLLLFGSVIYLFASTVKYFELHPKFVVSVLFNFVIAYITVKGLKLKVFVIYEIIIYYLAITGLLFWIIQLIMGGDILFDFLGRIPEIDAFSSVTGGGRSIIIYSVQPFNFMREGYAFPRNCGFAWEPGGFSVHLGLAIYINLFLVKSEVKFNSRFWILVLALLSTLSTTGYVVLITLLVFYFFQSNLKVVLLFFPVMIIGIVLLFSLPFMRDKIGKYYEEAQQIDLIVEESYGKQTARNPQRFASFIIAINDFIDNPVLGYGGHMEDRWFKKLGANIAPISGIGNLMAQYGIVGFLLFVILLINSSRLYAQYFNYKGAYLFFLIIILVTISYALILRPMIMSFWMYSFFEDIEIQTDSNNDS